MGKQIFSIKGMMRDLDPAKSPNQYAYEIRNLRLTAQEDTTMLALVSEKGNAQYTIISEEGEPFIIHGTIIGYCVLHNYLVLFTHKDGKTQDTIYRLEMKEMTMIAKMLYTGNLGFGDDGVELETLGIYENEELQKVYWIDSVHQPRFINIMASEDIMHSWNDDSFDFVPKIHMNELVEVSKSSYSGAFNSGTIQYVLTYYNRNGQQTAAFYQSPINYIAYSNRGASPEDTVDNSFKIKVINPDTNYDYVRIYSVFRSSENGTPVCKKVADIRTINSDIDMVDISSYIDVTLSGQIQVDESLNPLGTTNRIEVIDNNNVVCDLEDFLWYKKGEHSFYILEPSHSILIIPLSSGNVKKIKASEGGKMQLEIYNGAVQALKLGNTPLTLWTNFQGTRVDAPTGRTAIEYIDNGLSGETVDYSEVLFAGGTNIIPATMAQKDQTLFFGNYKTNSISAAYKEIIKNHSFVNYGYSDHKVSKGSVGGYYMYDNQLDESAKEITTFKGGEVYHFGIILQDSTGMWTEVIPVGGQRNNYYPKEDINDVEHFNPVKAYISFDDESKAIIDTYNAIKVVRLDTLPSVVYQGALAPTVFNHKREDNLPYCQSSWFFRQIQTPKNLTSHLLQNEHDANILDGNYLEIEAISEIQGAKKDPIGYYQQGVISSLTDMDMFVDWNTLTLHSPDIEFGQALNLNYAMRIVGYLPITSGRTSMSVTWKTAPYESSLGFLQYSPIIHNNLDTDGHEIDLNVFAYKDGEPNNGQSAYLYPIYPWHRNGSLTAQNTPSGSTEWYALLDTKVMASLRESAYTKYQQSLDYLVTRLKIYQDDNVPLLLEGNPSDYHHSDSKVYMGSIDTILTRDDAYYGYGKANNGTITQLGTNLHEPVRMRYNSTKHGVFTLLSNLPNSITVLPNVAVQDGSVTSNTIYENIQPTPIVFNVTMGSGVTFDGNILSGFSGSSSLSNGNVLIVGSNTNLFYVVQVINQSMVRIRALDDEWVRTYNPIKYQYNESHHDGSDGNWDTISYYVYFKLDGGPNEYTNYYRANVDYVYGHRIEDGEPESFDEYYVSTYTLIDQVGEVPEQVVQQVYNVDTEYQYIYLAELYTNDNLASNYEDRPWYVASEPKKTGKYSIEATIGDTYYQRYDCLKTYPGSLEDQNQIIEIFSFMCETKTNIDGRYDILRGLADNTTINKEKFNMLNRAYTQDDNFFTHHYIDEYDLSVNKFPNQIIWTKTKVYGSDIDAWTHIVATSILDMNGALGEVRALKLWNDNLICFQDMGIAKIMYNERTTMSTQQGVPVEIANSGKVDGSHYISNNIGCKNKKSIQTTQEGVYFIDSNKRELYRLSQGLESLSKSKGFNAYFYNSRINIDDIKTFYDSKLKDVYFRITKDHDLNLSTECLVFNEQLGEFTSFFDYDMDYMFDYKDSLVSIEHESSNLWKQFEGDEYLRYFDKTEHDQPAYESYSIEFVSAENPTEDKTFTNVEFRADVLDNSITIKGSQAIDQGNYASLNKLPFKTIRAWNEYQDTGETDFTRMIRKGTNLSQKFRIWRADIDRDNLDKVHKFNRIRSPWARIRLTGGNDNIKTVIHDMAVMYV